MDNKKNELDMEIRKLHKEFLKIICSRGFIIYIGIIYGGIALCLCYDILKGF